jgi:hypothetical protein
METEFAFEPTSSGMANMKQELPHLHFFLPLGWTQSLAHK